MNPEMSHPPEDDLEESLKKEFEDEWRKKVAVGVAVLVAGIAVTAGVLYYFGTISPVAW